MREPANDRSTDRDRRPALVTAGVEDWVVLNAIVSGLRRAERDEPDHLEVHVSGMAANASVDPGERRRLRWESYIDLKAEFEPDAT